MAILPGMGPRNNLPGSSPTPATRAADRTVKFRMRGALKYAFFPEIAPRLKRLGRSFGHFAYMLAMVFRSVRLLPANHPMLISANIGRFGIVDVISAAANNLVVSKKNTDQILIFGAIVLAIIMIVIQIAMIGFYAVMTPNVAQAADDGMFRLSNSAAESDVVMTFLQQTIGLDGFFNGANPIGISIAANLRAMLGFYSTGLMLIATCIVVYYVITVVGESAQSGTPFGRRFNGLWAPVRLVLALGLLVPLGNGLNASQYIALSVAKAGSSFASQAWGKFTSVSLSKDSMMVAPSPKGFTGTAKKIFMHEVCAAAYNLQNVGKRQVGVKTYVPHTIMSSLGASGWAYCLGTSIGGAAIASVASPAAGLIAGGVIASQTCVPGPDTLNVTVEWAAPSTSGDKPAFSCGAIQMRLEQAANDASKEAQKKVLNAYLKAIETAANELREPAVQIALRMIPADKNQDYNSTGPLPDESVLRNAIKKADEAIYRELVTDSGYRDKLFNDVLGGEDWKKGGWGNAALFYMKLSFANQRVADLIRAGAPAETTGASASQGLAAAVTANDSNAQGVTGTWWSWLFGQNLNQQGQEFEKLRLAMVKAEQQVTNWVPDTPQSTAAGIDKLNITGSVSEDDQIMYAVYSFFGINSLSSLVDPKQQHIFPMVKLSQIGADLLAKVPETFAVGFISSMASTAVGNMIFFIGLIGLGIGFLLYYVLPFMPFIYFFFAIVEWVMGVLESMLGAPLWALAHLRIDGEGMPGQAAMQGYNILLGILLRPFFILFGLLASYICFNSAANFLNQIYWGIVATRNGGEEGTVGFFSWTFNLGPLGLIGYLIVYAIIVYNLGLVCFKMIDQIPNQALRWMGIQDGTYKDGKQDPIGNISGAATTAGTLVSGQIANSASQVAGAAGGVGKGIASKGMGFIRSKGGGKGKAKGSP
ncbi:MAG: hypothetical protein EBQ96_09375 [Proteobacteria bacterium]|nr:hypothetical protein [Pseudomonadota bacterium]